MPDINNYAPQSGRVIGEDGKIHNLVDLLSGAGGGTPGEKGDPGEKGEKGEKRSNRCSRQGCKSYSTNNNRRSSDRWNSNIYR